MPKNPSVRQLRFLLSKGSPLSGKQKATLLDEARSNVRGKKLRKPKGKRHA